MAVVLSLCAALAYGLSDFVGGVVSRRVSPWTIYTQVPSLAVLQRPLTAFTISLAVLVAF